jgi:hypothetical protein
MNRIVIQKGEKLYLDSKIDYTTYVDTSVNINNKIYFTDGDNFFHFKSNGVKSPTFIEEIDLLLDNLKKIFNNCNTNTVSTQTVSDVIEKPNVYTMESNDKFYVELPQNTIIKMNDIPITLAVNTSFEIKPDTKFIIPEYSNIEIISRNNIYNISNREKINVSFSKLI